MQAFIGKEATFAEGINVLIDLRTCIPVTPHYVVTMKTAVKADKFSIFSHRNS